MGVLPVESELGLVFHRWELDVSQSVIFLRYSCTKDQECDKSKTKYNNSLYLLAKVASQRLAQTNQPTNQPTDQQTNQQTGQKQYVPHYYSGGHKNNDFDNR
ncbi:hypothetical protein DPMN_100768 [Dreissena polymorpha]|uniref:Uncharacterized protein n=1 Tax=Dreissena polymorpha TaxID=45954 RepID=A0A9D4R8H7_DREPO|nr:hypothetical protein DPMN_100768 [Dreissena polymorpha]